MRRLDISGCMSLTDAAFVHLQGIHTLSMTGCTQATVTDRVFSYFKDIRVLSARNCPQFTDAALKYPLPNIRYLDITGCKKITSHGLILVGISGHATLKTVVDQDGKRINL